MALSSHTHKPSWWRAECPACGKTKLFTHWLQYRESCEHCGWEIGSKDIGDGAVYILIILLGVVIGGLAVWTELRFEPPLWVHGALFIPLTFLLCVLSLRWCRAFLLHSIYAQEQHTQKDI